ncbi:MAG: shikimate kinase [Actinomycetota bacterium]|nr:shikimate kinase [Actinomycetota bacterium]
MKNIILIGFMGSGKSTVGKLLAKDLKARFIDLDEEIEKRERRSIKSIFMSDGEEAFRKLEAEMVGEASALKGRVIACGGGVVIDKNNVERLKGSGVLIYLKADLDTLIERATRTSHRPLLEGDDPKEKARSLLETREPLYEAAADRVINTSGLSLDEVVLSIKEVI